MLIEKNAHNFWPLEKNYTLFEIQRTNIRSFCIDLIQLYDELKSTLNNEIINEEEYAKIIHRGGAAMTERTYGCYFYFFAKGCPHSVKSEM